MEIQAGWSATLAQSGYFRFARYSATVSKDNATSRERDLFRDKNYLKRPYCRFRGSLTTALAVAMAAAIASL